MQVGSLIMKTINANLNYKYIINQKLFSTTSHVLKLNYISPCPLFGQQICPPMRRGGLKQVAEEKTRKVAKIGKRQNPILPLPTPAKIMKNENKIYFHPSNKSSWKPWKSRAQTPNENKMRKLWKHRNRRNRPIFPKTLKTTKFDTNHTNMISKWYPSLSHRYPVQNSDISPNGNIGQFSRITTKLPKRKTNCTSAIPRW